MSITIIDKIKKRAPIMVRTEIPAFKTEVDKQRYWEKEQLKYIEGVGDIPGSFYYFVQNCVMKDRITGKTFIPDVREVDLFLHQFIDNQRKKNRHGGLIKPRGVGFSTQIGGLVNYFIQIYPGATCLITSKNQKGTGLIFNQKIMPIYNNLPAAIRPATLNKNNTKQLSFLKLQTPVKSLIGGEVDFAESNILCYETSETPKSPQNFSGEGSIFGACDEFPLHPRRQELMNSAIECFRNPITKENQGFLLWGGTMEYSEELTSDKLQEFKKFRENCQTWDCDVLFIPYWMQMYTQENNGYPDKARAEEWWNRKYDELSKASDGSLLTAFIRNNPPDEASVWETAGGDRWEDDVMQLIKEQRRIVISTKPPRTQGILMDYNNDVEFKPSKDGNITKLEDPRAGCNYYCVVDGTATGTDTGGTKGSNVAALIIKGFDAAGESYKPVCMYFERPKTVEQSYIAISSMSKFYNKFGTFKGIMAEGNAGTTDHFSTYLNLRGLGSFIMYDRDLTGNSKLSKKRPFKYVTNDVRAWQVKQANPFLRKNITSITLLELLDQMLESEESNTDILDAWLMQFIAFPPDYDQPPREKLAKRRMVRHFTRDSNGMLTWEWRTV